MTVLDVIQRSAAYLEQRGVDSPRLQAELLLAHHLRLPRMQVYLNFERVLTADELQAVRRLIVRRGRREPLQQIVGCTSFCGLEIALNHHVLVPRPETELLAERAWEWLAEQAKGQPGTLNVLDFGTGSGCLAVILAAKCSATKVCALDLSAEALTLARQNALRHGVANRIHFLQSDHFAALPVDKKFALIVGNPPYIPTAELETLQPEVRDYEPRAALDGGEDGLRFYRRLATDSGARLEREGRIMLEFGEQQGPLIVDLFEQQNWVVEQILEDYTHRPRILVAKQKTG